MIPINMNSYDPYTLLRRATNIDYVSSLASHATGSHETVGQKTMFRLHSHYGEQYDEQYGDLYLLMPPLNTFVNRN